MNLEVSIKESSTKVQVIENFLDSEEIIRLLEIHSSQPVTRTKTYNTETNLDVEWSEIIEIKNRLSNYIGNFKIDMGHFFDSFEPYWTHVDTGMDMSKSIYKAILLPLYREPAGQCNIVFFKQKYFGSSVSFVKGAPAQPHTLSYNGMLEDYSEIEGLKKGFKISPEVYETYLNHMPYSTLEGLEVDTIVPWTPGSAIVFDRSQLHASGNFKLQGIHTKIGISIFTERA